MKKIYMDYAATTPTHPDVLKEMEPYFREEFGNPSSVHSFGRTNREKVEEAREQVALAIAAEPEEVVFTSGGTESDNYALTGVAFKKRDKGNHIITSPIEHHAVLETCKFLERQGFKITYLPVDKDGLVDPEDIKKAITDQTILVSIMHANNEIGTIEPIAEIDELLKEREICFHVDAVQTVGILDVRVAELQADLLSISAHKFYGPKGIGGLYIRKGTELEVLIHGGHQEKERRAGTENVPGIIGFGKAMEIASGEKAEYREKLLLLRQKLITGILESVDNVYLNGHPQKRLPNNVNLSFEFIEGESLFLNLDSQGIACSSGSACTSDAAKPSHVLLAIGVPTVLARGSLRFSIGRWTTEEDVDYLLSILPDAVRKLRAISPLARQSTGT